MIETAKKYFELGLSVIPVGNDKHPRLKADDKFQYRWKKHQTELLLPNGIFKNAYGIAIVCGNVSGGLECIDFDLKNDSTGTLFNDYKKLVNSYDNGILKKMVVEQSPSGGYHFIYRCSEVGGNKKLAKNNNAEGVIETRGEGGYFVCTPTEGYRMIFGAFDNISTITVAERRILIDCAHTFDSCPTEIEIPKAVDKKIIASNKSPFDDWNLRGDVISVLESEGWKQVMKNGENIYLRRPGSENNWGASYHMEKRLFYVFSDSVGNGFTNEKAYNATAVLTKMKFGGDFSQAAKWLLDNGYGERAQMIKHSKEPNSHIKIDDDNFDFVATKTETNEYIEQIRNGTFKMGLSTGFPSLNEHWRMKPATLVIINGHDNVGKSMLMWYFAMMSARLHKWRWIIYSSENKVGGVKKKIIEFMYGKNIKSFTDAEIDLSYAWFDEYFTIIRNKELYNYVDMLNMAKKLLTKKKYDCFLIDPFNSLDTDDSNKHEFDYRALTQFRLFIEQSGCGIYLNCHAVTEALRRKYPKGHKYEGHPYPPDKSDTEGGGKFSNKADDFLTVHRLTQHDTDKYFTEIHVKKIKEMETGGMHTSLESPIKLRLIIGGCGFEDESGFNPIATASKPIHTPTPITPNPHPDNFIQSIHEMDSNDPMPF